MADKINIRQPPKPEGYKEQWKIFGVLASSASQRKELICKLVMDYVVFGGELGSRVMQCAQCRGEFKAKTIHAEHIFPLHLVDRTDYPACLRYWSITNLEPVCVDCHKIKTKREVKANAKVKRIVARNTGTRRQRKAIANRPFPKLTEAQKQIQRDRQGLFANPSPKNPPIPPGICRERPDDRASNAV